MENAWNWDKAQMEVIESPADRHILVDAGPGTGKTAVACGRVAWLIDNGEILPTNIWLISFTRTAVQEIRDRIKEFLRDEFNAYSVRIATLDSHAWMIHSGFDRNVRLLGSYDDNIEMLTDKIREDKDGEISEYLQSVQHLIIDEAQDIVGIRADLVMAILDKLSDQCGITVFSDAAQAIYGFSLDEENRRLRANQKTLLEKIADKFGDDSTTCHLTKIFRTQSRTLVTLFTETRQKVLSPADNPRSKLSMICQEIRNLADDKNISTIDNERILSSENSFILFRRRAEVLIAASFMKKRPHRIRMSGLPHSIYPWLGACLSEHTKRRLSMTEFRDYWSIFVERTPLEPEIDSGEAWARLIRIAGESEKIVDMNLLRQRLGHGKPPADFSVREIGMNGPIIATIHSSKGREADNILLMMPAEPNSDKYNDQDYNEETRIVFVGATRARKWLGVGSGYNHHFAAKLEPSGRIYKIEPKKGYARVEIGLENDIIASGIAGRDYYNDKDIIRINQERMCDFAKGITNVSASVDPACNYIYRITPEDEEEDIASFSNSELASDLFKIAKMMGKRKRKPPRSLQRLRIYGVRTIVLPPDSPECNSLCEPWSRSGIMLAPIIIGYTRELFPYYN
jgi:hypothetical protein